jgi:hypothetical protein
MLRTVGLLLLGFCLLAAAGCAPGTYTSSYYELPRFDP